MKLNFLIIFLIFVLSPIFVFAAEGGSNVTYDVETQRWILQSGGKSFPYQIVGNSVDSQYSYSQTADTSNVGYTPLQIEGSDQMFNGQPIYSNNADNELFAAQYDSTNGKWVMQQVYSTGSGSEITYNKCTSPSQSTCGSGSWESTVIKSQDRIRDYSRGPILRATNAEGEVEYLQLFEDGSTEEHYCSANCNTDKPTVNKCTTRSQEGCDAHGDGLNSSFITGELGREMYELDHGAEVTRTENAPYLITGEMVPNKVYTTATYYDTSNLEGGGKLDIDGDINGLQLDKSFSGSERSQDEWRGGFGEFLGSIGTTLPIMRLLFPDRTTDIFTSYDKWAHGLYGTEYFESLVCKGELTDQASEGLSQIKLQDGSIATTAHVTGQKRGPNALLCDLAAEEPCPNDGECDDGLCYLDKELMYAYEYIIEWAARSPADSALSPGINEANEPYVSFNVHIQCIENSYGCPEEVDGNGWYPLYTSDFGSEGVIMLTPGQQDSDKIVTYSVYNYDKVKFDWFIAPEGVSFNSGGDIFGVADSGFGDGGQARDIESSIVDLGSSPSTVNYQESEVSTVNSVSSSNSEITRSTI